MEETKPFVISKQVVKIAFDRVKANKGTYGIDEQTIADFEENLKDVNGKIICRKMAKKNVVFPTYFCIKNSMI